MARAASAIRFSARSRAARASSSRTPQGALTGDRLGAVSGWRCRRRGPDRRRSRCRSWRRRRLLHQAPERLQLRPGRRGLRPVPVGEAGAEVDRLQLVLDLPQGLGGAQEEVAVGREDPRHLVDHPALERPPEVDQHVAQQDEVALRERQVERRLRQVELAVEDARAQLRVELEQLAPAPEVALQQRRRHLADGPVAVEAQLRARERPLVHVGRQDRPVPAFERRLLVEQDQASVAGSSPRAHAADQTRRWRCRARAFISRGSTCWRISSNCCGARKK